MWERGRLGEVILFRIALGLTPDASLTPSLFHGGEPQMRCAHCLRGRVL